MHTKFKKQTPGLPHAILLKYFNPQARRGSSLLIALGLISIIVIVAIGVSTIVASSIRQSANVNSANQAYYAAEGALESGLLDNLENGSPGFNTAASVTYPSCAIGNPNCILKANYTVQGQVTSNPNLKYPDAYGIPTPGTGDIGKNCDLLNPVVSTTFWYSSAADQFDYSGQLQNNGYSTFNNPKDHPCNWNKIKVGETLTIPLYVTTTDPACPSDSTGSGNNVCNPVDQGLTSIIIKIRTACPNSQQLCDAANRPNLDTSVKDDTIVDWEIQGTSRDGLKNYVLNPYRYFCSGVRCEPFNSEIYENLINATKSLGNVVLQIDNSGSGEGGEDFITNPSTLGYIIDFLLNNSPWDVLRPNANTDSLDKPSLKLTVIHSLQDPNSNAIPYLEYQILTNVSNSILPADSVQTVTAEGYSGTFKQVLEVKQPHDSNILEYVIQQ